MSRQVGSAIGVAILVTMLASGHGFGGYRRLPVHHHRDHRLRRHQRDRRLPRTLCASQLILCAKSPTATGPGLGHKARRGTAQARAAAVQAVWAADQCDDQPGAHSGNPAGQPGANRLRRVQATRRSSEQG